MVVFVLTQDGRFYVTKTFSIKAPKDNVFNYIKTLKNWQDWTVLTQTNDSTYKVQLHGFSPSELKTIKSYQTDSLFQHLHTHRPTSIKWVFKDLGNQTEVQFDIQGTLDLKAKVKRFWDGTPSLTVERAIEKDLSRLTDTLNYQYGFNQIETIGPEENQKTYYIYLNQKSTLLSFHNDLKNQFPRLESFITQYNLDSDLKPLAIFHTFPNTDTVDYRIALPISKKIYLNQDDPVQLDSLSAPYVFKTLTHGYFWHIPKAISQSKESFNKSNIKPENNFWNYIRFSNFRPEDSKPSLWETELYIPISAPIAKDSIGNYAQ